MRFPGHSKVERLRGLFEGKEAIYVEKGALRVRVSDIRGDIARGGINAEVEEIPTVGLPAAFLRSRRDGRWEIGAGFLSRFSDHTWHMGYGGWSLFFAPSLVESIVSLALQFPESLDQIERYNQVLKLTDQTYEPTQRLFTER